MMLIFRSVVLGDKIIMTKFMVRLCCDYNHSNDMEIIEIANLLDELSKDAIKNYTTNIEMYMPAILFNYGVSSGNSYIPTVFLEGFTNEISVLTSIIKTFTNVQNQFYKKYKDYIHVDIYRIQETYSGDRLIKGE